MRKCFVLLCLIIAFSAFCQKNENDEPKRTIALQFGISDIITFNGYNGSMISGKYAFSDTSAIELGLSCSYDRPYENSEDLTDGKYYSYDGDNEKIILSSSLCFTRYLKKTKPIFLYYDLGINGSFVQDSSLRTYDTEYVYKSTRIIGYGILCNLGVEWPFTENMSLFLEYGIGLQKKDTRTKEDNTYSYSSRMEKTTIGHEYHVYNKDIFLGLCIYIN
jgi:hypothetical protein